MNEEERRAVFYKLEHEKPVDPATTLSGTDLKPIAQPTPEIVYAVPRQESLSKLAKKLDDFATGPVKKDHVPNEWLAYLVDIQEADPKDRLSDDMREQYAALAKSKSLICKSSSFPCYGDRSNKRKRSRPGYAILAKTFSMAKRQLL